MFHRRLTLLWCVSAAVALMLAVQMTRLAVGQGAQRRSAAEKRLDLVTYLPTYRGTILDGQGRILAVDRPSHDVAVDYEVITGAWAVKQAARKARSADWAQLSPTQRDAAVARHLPEFQERIDRLWEAIINHGGIDRAELDRRLDVIKQEVQRTAAIVWDRQLRQEIRFERAPPDGRGFRPRPIREQRQAHVVLPRVPDAVAFALRRAIEQEGLPGAEVLGSHRRGYPWQTADVTLDRSTLPAPLRTDEPITIRVNGVADHILGLMRAEVWAADRRRRPFKDPITGQVDLGGYRLGDVVGDRGLERVFEDHLRGLRGLVRKRLDTGHVERTPHVPGRNLHLTLDIALQAQVQAIFSPKLGLTTVQQYQAGWHGHRVGRPTELPLGTRLNGAAVVLEVETGEILALVSMPTNATAKPQPCAADDEPWVNRPVEAIYPPGSIAKPIVLLAAVTEGVHSLADPIECAGHYFPDRIDAVRCWVYRPPRYATHGSVAASEALARSCNIYFYTLGDRLGVKRLGAWFERFGVGEPFDVGLLDEIEGSDGALVRRGGSGGSVPGEDEIAALSSTGELRFTGVILGIGQGPVTWTPLHAANAYATLARRGARCPPSIVREPRAPNRATDDLALDDDLVALILEGLRQSVSEVDGTGHHISYPDGTVEPIMNADGVVVWAKTGTAQAPPRSFDLDCDGVAEITLADPSHAWFVGLVGPGAAQPRYAIAVVIEYGGSGGRTAGPVANQIIRALQRLGYLSDDAT